MNNVAEFCFLFAIAYLPIGFILSNITGYATSNIKSRKIKGDYGSFIREADERRRIWCGIAFFFWPILPVVIAGYMIVMGLEAITNVLNTALQFVLERTK